MARDGDEHLIALIGMMGSSSGAGDGEGVNAFRVASRALAKRGLTWRDLAERALRAPPAPPPRPIWQGDPSSRQQSTQREREDARRSDAGRDRAYAPPPPPPPPPEPPRVKPRRSSHGVPAAIGGVINVIDDDRRSRLIVFEVDGKDALYGPILAHGGGVRDNIINANGRYATLRVRPPRQEGSMPVAVGCSSL